MTPQERKSVLGVYSTHEKAVQAVERSADESGEWLDRTWRDYSMSWGLALAYYDEDMKNKAGTYYITMHDLQ